MLCKRSMKTAGTVKRRLFMFLLVVWRLTSFSQE